MTDVRHRHTSEGHLLCEEYLHGEHAQNGGEECWGISPELPCSSRGKVQLFKSQDTCPQLLLYTLDWFLGLPLITVQPLELSPESFAGRTSMRAEFMMQMAEYEQKRHK